MRAGCAVQTSKPVTSNAQVLSSLPGHHLATSLVGLHTQYMHPKYCGFSLLWVCVWSAPSKPQWDRACWPSCGELWLRKHRTAWMPAAMTTRHGAVWRHRHGSNATWQGCLHNGATKVPLGAVSARWLSGAIAAYANIEELAWVPAVESQFKVGQLLRIVFRTCAMAVCSPHYHCALHKTSLPWILKKHKEKIAACPENFPYLCVLPSVTEAQTCSSKGTACLYSHLHSAVLCGNLVTGILWNCRLNTKTDHVFDYLFCIWIASFHSILQVAFQHRFGFGVSYHQVWHSQ